MKNITHLLKITFILTFLLSFENASAQLDLPRNSQQASITQHVGISTVTVNYARPSVKGREIWGKLVPYGMVDLGFGTAKESPWRAGADENTTISFSDPTTINGKYLAAGTYGLHMVPFENGKATIIFSNNSTAWGSYFYDPSEDALRVDVATNDCGMTELLTFEFSAISPKTTTLSLKWEKMEIPMTFEFDVTNLVMTSIRQQLQNSPGFSNQSWTQAANFALNNDGDLEEALGYINNSIEGQFYSQKNVNNLLVKSRILDKMGKKEESFKIVDEAVEYANIRQLNTIAGQIISQDKERGLRYYRMNINKNPKNAAMYANLGDAYKKLGDKRNAKKVLKKGLKMKPSDAVKSRINKLLKEL